MAPEVFRDPSLPRTVKYDVYSFGVLLWELLSGQKPFEAGKCSRLAHCLNHLYTVKPRPPGAMQLRTRGHQFELPAVKYEFNKRNFIV